MLQIYKIICLKPIGGGIFFVFEDFRGVESGDWRGVPGGEYIFIFTDDSDEIVITLGMGLKVGQELELIGLQGTDDLRFEVGSGAALSDDVEHALPLEPFEDNQSKI
ncbi:hypothetical protein M1D30_10830 [Prevotella sp. E15-22]|nr:hypothetical protein [Prevotella sp. E15-22]UPS44058.1 hypothetical protein M1D30_10830 [Prevotella sp. E15-22]